MNWLHNTRLDIQPIPKFEDRVYVRGLTENWKLSKNGRATFSFSQKVAERCFPDDYAVVGFTDKRIAFKPSRDTIGAFKLKERDSDGRRLLIMSNQRFGDLVVEKGYYVLKENLDEGFFYIDIDEREEEC